VANNKEIPAFANLQLRLSGAHPCYLR